MDDLIQRFYAAFDKHDGDAMAACYAPDARFRDIAFDLEGQARIHEMWRMICSGDIQAACEIDHADAATGAAHSVFTYHFGASKNPPSPGRPVVNPIKSTFTFRDGLIARQEDDCDARAWARQAIGTGLAGFLAGRVRWLRSRKAEAKVAAFLKANPKERV